MRKLIAATYDTRFAQAGAARGQRGGAGGATRRPLFLRIPCPPPCSLRPQETWRPRSVQSSKTVGCSGEAAEVPRRVEQGTEIKRGLGRGLRPHPRGAAPGQAALGSRTGRVRPRAWGHTREGQEGPPGPEAEGTLKMQSSLESPVSQEGWPSRYAHDCEGEGTRGAGEGPWNLTLLPREWWPVPHLTPQHPSDVEYVNAEHPQPGLRGSQLSVGVGAGTAGTGGRPDLSHSGNQGLHAQGDPKLLW